MWRLNLSQQQRGTQLLIHSSPQQVMQNLRKMKWMSGFFKLISLTQYWKWTTSFLSLLSVNPCLDTAFHSKFILNFFPSITCIYVDAASQFTRSIYFPLFHDYITHHLAALNHVTENWIRLWDSSRWLLSSKIFFHHYAVIASINAKFYVYVHDTWHSSSNEGIF